MQIELRLERPEDFFEVEMLAREAFWNLFVPGCDEPYLMHQLRTHRDFIPELDYVATLNGKIVGNIMYSRSRLVAEDKSTLPCVTFGPISVHPHYQRKGIGKLLMRKTFELVSQTDAVAIVIWGMPKNYVSCGFKNCKDYNISIMPGKFPTCLLVQELKPGILGEVFYTFSDSEVFAVDQQAAAEYDKKFPPKERFSTPSQEEFRIMSSSWCLPGV